MKTFQDKVVNEAREKCIEKSCIPRDIIKKYNSKIKNGKVIIGAKK